MVTGRLEDVEQSASACYNATAGDGGIGRYLNTPAVATDMLSMGKALAREKGQPEDKALVNFLGISYGTVLGQYFASLYPKNVGRFLLDGVVDINSYHTKDATGHYIHSDEAASGFFTACHEAGPKLCAFYAEGNGSSDATRERFNRISAKLNLKNVTMPEGGSAELALSLFQTVKTRLVNALYSPRDGFKALAEYLVTVEEALAPGDPSLWNATAISFNENDTPESGAQSDLYYQISCTDAPDMRGQEVTEADSNAAYGVSKLTGQSAVNLKYTCTKWRFRPVWEWYGPIGGTTATPILFMGNHLDPVTPYEKYV
ncbi:hypothetical protein ABW20_dc0104319 [Dactylellina cionopaga]|nr:hypothetical protein ABW20_dc0104319 [Dactylellina cionopaga]